MLPCFPVFPNLALVLLFASTDDLLLILDYTTYFFDKEILLYFLFYLSYSGRIVFDEHS